MRPSSIGRTGDNSIVLSVAIPTYNQPKKLLNTLNSLIPQVKGKSVEIVICNDSEENKQAMHLLLESKTPFFIYYRPIKGFDSAVESLTSICKGEYIWYLGDEEVLEGSVDYILSILEKRPNMVWVNSVSDTGKPSFSQLSTDWLEGEYTDLPKISGIKMFSLVNDLLGFISTIVVKREMMLEYMRSDRTFQNTWIDFVHPLLRMMSLDNNYLCARPCFKSVSTEITNRLGYDTFNVWGIQYPKIINSTPYYLIAPEKRPALKNLFKRIWKAIVVSRAKDMNYNYGSVKLSDLKWWSYSETYLMALALLIPKTFLKIAYSITR